MPHAKREELATSVRNQQIFNYEMKRCVKEVNQVREIVSEHVVHGAQWIRTRLFTLRLHGRLGLSGRGARLGTGWTSNCSRFNYHCTTD